MNYIMPCADQHNLDAVAEHTNSFEEATMRHSLGHYFDASVPMHLLLKKVEGSIYRPKEGLVHPRMTHLTHCVYIQASIP